LAAAIDGAGAAAEARSTSAEPPKNWMRFRFAISISQDLPTLLPPLKNFHVAAAAAGERTPPEAAAPRGHGSFGGATAGTSFQKGREGAPEISQ
jgi:hypothetical protein